MKVLATLVFLLSLSPKAAIYKGNDTELSCERYMAQNSQYLDSNEAQLADTKQSQILKRVSIKAALNFSKSHGKFNLKGTMGYWPILMDVSLGDYSEEYLMNNIFKSVCIHNNQVVDVEFSRKALNNWNNVDALRD